MSRWMERGGLVSAGPCPCPQMLGILNHCVNCQTHCFIYAELGVNQISLSCPQRVLASQASTYKTLFSLIFSHIFHFIALACQCLFGF